MASIFDRLFKKNKTSDSAGSDRLSKVDKLLLEKKRLQRELRRTKIVSANQREEMLTRIDEIDKTLYKLGKNKSE